jgi:cytochrome c553
MTPDRPWWRSYLVLGAVGAAVAALVIELVMSSLSGTPPGLVLFFGRFHPLAVHLPIGVFLLVAAAELTSFWPAVRARVEPALELLLAAMVVSALGAFALGQMLALGGGFPGGKLLLHRRLTLFTVIGASLCLIAWVYHRRSERPRALLAYRGLVAATLGVLSLGAHFGGTMTRGDAYLSKYAPGPLKPLLGGSAESEAPPEPPKLEMRAEPLLFADVVQPIFERYCVECHGEEEEEEEAEGGLRLDSLEAIVAGGDSGQAVSAGAAEQSLLVERMLLPLDDDDRMPPEEREGPKPEEIEIVKFWIDRGLGDALEVRDTLAPTSARALLEKIVARAPAQPRTKTDASKASSSKTDASKTDPASAQPEPSDAPAPEPASEPDSDGPPGASPENDASGSSAPGASERAPPASGSGGPFAILANKCEKCHGAEKQKAKLRVDSLAALLSGGKQGPAVVPGDPDASLLIEAVRRPLDAKGHMPPKKEPQLSAAEIATLAAWVRGGAGRGRSAPAAMTSEPSPAATDFATPDLGGADPGMTAGSDGDEAAQATDDGSASSQPTRPIEPSTNEVNQNAQGAAPPPEAAPIDPALVDALPERVALFADFVKPALDKRCGGCHKDDDPSGGLSMADVASLRSGGDSGPAIVPGDANASLLVERVLLPVSDSDHMPPDGLPDLTPGEIGLVSAWIERGATPDTTARTRELPPAAQRVIAERTERRAPPESAPPPVAAASGRAGGCAACTIGVRAGKLHGTALALAAALALAWRRRGAFGVGRRRR